MSGWPWQLDLTVVRDLMREVQPILDSKVVAAGVAAIIGIVTFRWKEKEKLAAAVAWDWTMRHNMQEDEVPFLVVQNMGSIPAYITSVRYLRGNWWRRPVKRPLPSKVVVFDEPTDDGYPLTVPPASAGKFMMEQSHIQKIAEGAGRFARCCHWLGRPYVWIEIRTIAGRRLMISAREGICPRDRQDWW